MFIVVTVIIVQVVGFMVLIFWIQDLLHCFSVCCKSESNQKTIVRWRQGVHFINNELIAASATFLCNKPHIKSLKQMLEFNRFCLDDSPPSPMFLEEYLLCKCLHFATPPPDPKTNRSQMGIEAPIGMLDITFLWVFSNSNLNIMVQIQSVALSPWVWTESLFLQISDTL